MSLYLPDDLAAAAPDLKNCLITMQSFRGVESSWIGGLRIGGTGVRDKGCTREHTQLTVGWKPKGMTSYSL